MTVGSARGRPCDRDSTHRTGSKTGKVPTNAGRFWKLRKARKQILPWSPQKDCSPANTLILVRPVSAF